MPSNNDKGDRPSSNRLDSKEYQDALRKRNEEALLFNRFKQVATTKLESMANEAKAGGPPYTMGENEKEIFRQLQGMGVKEGIMATAVAFVTLRRGPILVGRWIQKRRLANHHERQMTTNMTPPPASKGFQLADPGNPFANAANPNFPRSRSFFIRSIWFLFDTVLSMAYTDTDKIRDQLIDLPLVQGRSLTSDALCDEIVKELQRVRTEKDPAYVRLTKQSGQDTTPAAFFLKGIIAFSENCQRRRFLERELRQERGLGPNEPVEIPEPGVSQHGPRWIESSTGEETTGGSEDDEFEDLTRWASDVVSDNEDTK